LEKEYLNKYYFISGLITVLLILSCSHHKPIDVVSILSQLPVDNRPILVPESLVNKATSVYNLISFDSIRSIDNEEVFYTEARSLGIQYILISSSMIEDGNQQFPWMLNKNFKVCPGFPDKNAESYFVLLVWDNTKNSYHFFKFIYESQE